MANYVNLIPALQIFLTIFFQQPWSSKIKSSILTRNKIELVIHGRHYHIWDFCYDPKGNRWYTEQEGDCLILTFADQNRDLLSAWIHDFVPLYGLEYFISGIQWLLDNDEEPGDWTRVD